MRLHRVLPAVLASAALAAPAAAQADLTPLSPVSHAWTAALAGAPGAVAWGESVRNDTNVRVRTAAPGRAAATVFSATAAKGILDNPLEVLGSPTRLAALRTEYPSDSDGQLSAASILAGPSAGPLAPLASADLALDAPLSFDLSGDLLAAVERAGTDLRVVVHDLASGTAAPVGPTLARTFPYPQVRIAGDRVAIAAAASGAQDVRRITVYDRATSTALFSVDVPITLPYGVGFGWDLQADGTVAVLARAAGSTGAAPKSDLAWASVAQPTLHTVATDVRWAAPGPRIAGDRILVARGRDDGPVRLALVGLDGSTAAVGFPMASWALTGVDWDGARVAVVTDACAYSGDPATSVATGAPPGAGCAAQDVALRDARTSGRTLRTRVVCAVASAAASDGACHGTLTVRARARRGSGTVLLATRAWTGGVASVTSLRLVATHAGLAKARHTGSGRRCRVTATVAAGTARQSVHLACR